MKQLPQIRDERGTTLVELMVGASVGIVVLYALTMAILTTMHGTAKVSARVHATQDARVALTNVMEELHSACLAPKITPVQAGSSGTSLGFVHAARSEGAEAAPKPTLSVISLTGDTLTQSDYAWATGASQKEWTFAPTPTTRQLMTGVAPVPPSSSIFTYYTYLKGAISPTPLEMPLTDEAAATTIEVRAALAVTPDGSGADDGAPASIQNRATLRLTPPSFNESAPSPPCQ